MSEKRPDREVSAQTLEPLLAWLKDCDYRFITPTASTHRTVAGRPAPAQVTLRDIFGWNRPFALDALAADWRERLLAAGVLTRAGDLCTSTVRVASLGRDLFAHSAFPPAEADAVFFGPDTYRYARFLAAELTGYGEVGVAVDLGTGSGAGAVAAARATSIGRLVLIDVNPRALRHAKANLAAAGLSADFRLGDGLTRLDEPVDLIIANPPFIAGGGGRTYREGGDMHGARISLNWALAGAGRLKPGGRFLLYTGSAIIEGRDRLREALMSQLPPQRFSLRYEEIDPDIFGGQLRRPEYAGVERIAAVGAVITAAL